MKKRKRLVKSVEFSLDEGRSLVISLSSSVGLDRIVIENKNGVLRARAEGHSRFEFSDKKGKPGACDFWLANPQTATALEDYLEGSFWSQFNWDELFRHRKNIRLRKALKAEIRRLVHAFEGKAAERLNGILKEQRKT